MINADFLVGYISGWVIFDIIIPAIKKHFKKKKEQNLEEAGR